MVTADRAASLRRVGSLLGLLGLEAAAVAGLHRLGRLPAMRIPWERAGVVRPRGRGVLRIGVALARGQMDAPRRGSRGGLDVAAPRVARGRQGRFGDGLGAAHPGQQEEGDEGDRAQAAHPRGAFGGPTPADAAQRRLPGSADLVFALGPGRAARFGGAGRCRPVSPGPRRRVMPLPALPLGHQIGVWGSGASPR